MISNVDSAQTLRPKMIFKLFALIVPISLVVLEGVHVIGPIFIEIFYGETYFEEASNILYILLVGISFYPIQVIMPGFLNKFHSVFLVLSTNLLAFLIFLATLFINNQRGVLDIEVFAYARSIAMAYIGIT